MTQNILNEVKHRKVDLEQIKRRDKEALEVKMGEEVGKTFRNLVSLLV